MNDINSLRVQGNLVHDPKLTQVSDNAKVCAARIATHRYRPVEFNEAGKPTRYVTQTSFLDVEGWNFLAESLNGFSKGDKVEVIGHIEQDRWMDRETKLPRQRVKIIADVVQKAAKPVIEDPQVDEAPEVDQVA